MRVLNNDSIIKIHKGDLKELADFISKENKDKSISYDYLNWWYFMNPHKRFSVYAVKVNNIIEGMATTNNFALSLNKENKSIAMPQKVLTSKKIRGKGYFGKLYNMTEDDNIQNNQTDFFMTITNEASTPIFINKFNYSRGECPEINMLFSNPYYYFKKSNCYPVTTFDQNYFSDYQIKGFDNAFNKSFEYYKWRYIDFNQLQIKILAILDSKKQISGFVILKKIYKKKIPLFLLMDLITHSHEHIEYILLQSLIYATQNKSLGILAFKNDTFPIIKFRKIIIKNKFNFLVKSKNKNEANTLSKIKFNLFFGDLDFI